MKRAFLACLVLAGCQNQPSRSEFAAMQFDIAKQASRATDLERQVKELQQRDEAQDRYISAVYNVTDAVADQQKDIADQVDQNAKAANRNALKDMTRRGACGTDWQQVASGGAVPRNRECTLKDLAR